MVFFQQMADVVIISIFFFFFLREIASRTRHYFLENSFRLPGYN